MTSGSGAREGASGEGQGRGAAGPACAVRGLGPAQGQWTCCVLCLKRARAADIGRRSAGPGVSPVLGDQSRATEWRQVFFFFDKYSRRSRSVVYSAVVKTAPARGELCHVADVAPLGGAVTLPKRSPLGLSGWGFEDMLVMENLK